MRRSHLPPPKGTLQMEHTGHPTGVLPVRLGILTHAPKVSYTLDQTGHPARVLPVRQGILQQPLEVPCIGNTRPSHWGVTCPVGDPPLLTTLYNDYIDTCLTIQILSPDSLDSLTGFPYHSAQQGREALPQTDSTALKLTPENK